MGYRVVTVSPLKQFPIASLKLANVVSISDVRQCFLKKYREMAKLRIDSDDAYNQINGGKSLSSIGRAEVYMDYEKVAEKELEKFEEERWPKIEPAFKLHLERQERRKKHFESACRLEGCDNPRREKRVRGLATSTKARRPGARPLFCGVHVWLRKCLKQEALDALHKSSANRVRLV